MKRLSTAILIALIVGLFASHNAYAAPSYPKVFLADFDGDTAVYYAAVYDKDDHYTAIKFWLTDETVTPHEDDVTTDQATYLLTNTLDLALPTFTENDHSFTWSYMDDIDYSTVTNVVNHGSYFEATLNGKQIQAYGFLQSGTVAMLRIANAYATNNANGYLLQNGNLISYTVSNDEPQVTHKIYMSVIL